MDAFLPATITDSGVTTAEQDEVINSSAELPISGTAVMICVGLDAIYIRFGRIGTTAVTASNGMRLGANSITFLTVPQSATKILHIRETGDSTISVQGGFFST